MWLLQKQPFESFAKFPVNFQDVISFGEILKKLNANFGKILKKRKFLKMFVNFKENMMEILIGLRNILLFREDFE